MRKTMTICRVSEQRLAVEKGTKADLGARRRQPEVRKKIEEIEVYIPTICREC